MYGLLFESIQFAIQRDYGEDLWYRVLVGADCKNQVFTSHHTYSAGLMTKLATALSKELPDKSQSDVLEYFGTVFVEFCDHYGYHDVLCVSGRHYRDFLNGIDNLHEIMRFSYPRMRTPSFYVTHEDEGGCILHYRSKRIGFEHYVIGQLKTCGERFYNVAVKVKILTKEILDGDRGCHVSFRLDYHNHGFKPKTSQLDAWSRMPPQYQTMSCQTFFGIFPFSVVFDSNLVITYAGKNLTGLLQENVVGQQLTERFKLRRPLMNLTWQNVVNHQQVVFELEHELVDPNMKKSIGMDGEDLVTISSHSSTDERAMKSILLRGQMKYIDSNDCIIFLCTPLLGYLEDLLALDLYINDLSMHDGSRDMVLAGWQHASRLEHSIEKQEQESHLIEKNLKELDEWKQKGDSMLYSMIPKSIAVRLKNGEDAVNTCQFFEEVTIMFSYVVHFSEICSRVGAMMVVKTINEIFTLFDHISDRYNVFKVETLGDAVYMVAGGVPDKTPDHAKNVAGLALELLRKITVLSDPSDPTKRLQLRTGMHTGSVVGGVVGKRMPQYCLFGDTVNTASRMETNSLGSRVHVSEPCQRHLKDEFSTTFRGTIEIKGKGNMNTYWLLGPKDKCSNVSLTEADMAALTKRQFSPSSPGYDLHSIHAVSTVSQMEVIDDDVMSIYSVGSDADDGGLVMKAKSCCSSIESCHLSACSDKSFEDCYKNTPSPPAFNNNTVKATDGRTDSRTFNFTQGCSYQNGSCDDADKRSAIIEAMNETDFQLYANGLLHPKSLKPKECKNSQVTDKEDTNCVEVISLPKETPAAR